MDCPNTSVAPMKSVSYKSDYGNTYVTIPPSSGLSVPAGSKTSVRVTCTLTECLQNTYLSNGECEQCPDNGWSDPGSTSVASCEQCPGGTYLSNSQAECSLSTEYSPVSSSKGWRLWTTTFHMYVDWSWDVEEIEFFANTECSGFPIDNSGEPIDSGNAGSGYDAAQAFGGGGFWGGRGDRSDLFWIGMMYDTGIQVQCVKLHNAGEDRSTSELRVQAYNEVNGAWENVWIEGNLDGALDVNIISLDYQSTGSPTESPNNAPAGTPTKAPIVASECNDSPLKMKVNKKPKMCAWVLKKDKQTVKGCGKPGVKSHCPVACESLDEYCTSDSTKRIQLNNGKWKSCKWVKINVSRCDKKGVFDTCRETCATV